MNNRRVLLDRLALAGLALLVLVVVAAGVALALRSHHGNPQAHPRPGASTHAAGPVTGTITACSQAAAGSPQQVACQVVTACFRRCAGPDPEGFLAAVRRFMTTSAASDLADQASFTAPSNLRHAQVLGVTECAGSCTLSVRTRGALGYGITGIRDGWIQLSLIRTDHGWVVSAVAWRMGSGP